MKYKSLIFIFIAAFIAVLIAAQFYQPEISDDVLQASGRIEGRSVTVTPKVSAIVLGVNVDEGETVEVNTSLAELHDQALLEKLHAAQSSLGLLQTQRKAAEIDYQLACSQVPLKIEQAEAQLAAAQAHQKQSAANHEQAVRDARRIQDLASKNLAAPQQLENAKLKASIAEIALQASRSSVISAEKQLALAKLGKQQLTAQEARVDALGCQIDQARAQLAEVESYIDELNIIAPSAGTVITRSIEPGERVNPGTPLFTLVNLDRLYLKIFIPEPQLGKITLGQEARIYVDAYPDQAFPARVSKIAQQAEFTPKNIETRDERVKLVFAVELQVDENPDGHLKPGMPADAFIRLTPDAEWPNGI